MGLSPRSSPETLIRAVESLSVSDPESQAMKEAVSLFLNQDMGDFDGAFGSRELWKYLVGFARLVHRYGAEAPAGGAKGLFACPGCSLAEDTISLRYLSDPGVWKIAARLPRTDRHALEEILTEALPKFGFLGPLPEELAGVSLEEAAVWSLVLRTALEFQGEPSGVLAQAILIAVGSGRSKNFFDPVNANSYYRFFFEDAGPALVETRTLGLYRVALERRLRPELSLGGSEDWLEGDDAAVIEEGIRAFGFRDPEAARSIGQMSPRAGLFWRFLFRASALGEEPVRRLSDAVFFALSGVASKNFFDPANDNTFHRLLFDEGGTGELLDRKWDSPGHIDGLARLFERAAERRKGDGNLPIESVYYYVLDRKG